MVKTVVITGTTGAIGNATAIELARNNCRVIMLGRNEARLAATKTTIEELTGNRNIEICLADMSEPESVQNAAAEIKGRVTSLNALINVAAVFKKQRHENSCGNEYMFATNHLGPFILTNALLDLLKAGKPARIVTVSAPSTTRIRFDDIDGKQKFSAGFLGAFGASKMMNIMFTYALARRLENTGVTTSVFHPGLVRSELMNEMPALLRALIKGFSGKPGRAAGMLCSLATGDKYQSMNGTFIRYDGKEIQSSAYSHDITLQEKLWELSEKLTH